MRLKDRASRLFSRRPKLQEHAVVASIEHPIFADVSKRAARLRESLDSPPVLPSGTPLDRRVWQALATDVFSEYMGMDEPTIRSRDRLDAKFHVNRELAAKTAQGDSFAERHAMTRGETLESTIATLGALDSLRRSYGEELAEHGEQANAVAKQQDEVATLDDLLGQLRQDRQQPDADLSSIDEQ